MIHIRCGAGCGAGDVCRDPGNRHQGTESIGNCAPSPSQTVAESRVEGRLQCLVDGAQHNAYMRSLCHRDMSVCFFRGVEYARWRIYFDWVHGKILAPVVEDVPELHVHALS
jgi:hypothetical protein